MRRPGSCWLSFQTLRRQKWSQRRQRKRALFSFSRTYKKTSTQHKQGFTGRTIAHNTRLDYCWSVLPGPLFLRFQMVPSTAKASIECGRWELMIGSAGLKIKDRDASQGPDTRTTEHHPAVERLLGVSLYR